MGKKRDYSRILAEENFLVGVQSAVRDLMQIYNVSQKNLADRLGCTEGRVSQLLSDDTPNLTLKKVAEIFYVLNEEPHLLSKELMALRLRDEEQWNEKYRSENSILSKLGLSVDRRQLAQLKQEEWGHSKGGDFGKRVRSKETFAAVAVALTKNKIEWPVAGNDNLEAFFEENQPAEAVPLHGY